MTMFSFTQIQCEENDETTVEELAASTVKKQLEFRERRVGKELDIWDERCMKIRKN